MRTHPLTHPPFAQNVADLLAILAAFGSASCGPPPATVGLAVSQVHQANCLKSFAALIAVAISPSQHIYYAGGDPGGSDADRDSLDSAAVYDPASNSHADLPSMGTRRHYVGMGRLGGLVCAVGGSHNGVRVGFLDSCECLDTANPGAGWSDYPSLRTARMSAAVASTGDTMCAIGGATRDNGWTKLASVECLSQGATAWVEVASLNIARFQHCAAAIGNVIFALGGSEEAGGSLEALDLGADGGGWEEKAPMPTARRFVAVAASGTRLFVVGGHTLEIYESVTDSWSAAAPMPTARSGLAAAIVGNALFALGGLSGGNTVDVVEVYDIEGDSWSAAEPMGASRWGLAAVAGP